MSVAHEDGIDARNLLRNRHCSIFIWNLSRIDFAGSQILFKAHVHRDDYQVRAFFVSQYRQPTYAPQLIGS